MTTQVNGPEVENVEESGEIEDFEDDDNDDDDKPEVVEEQNQTGDERKTSSSQPLKKISKVDKTTL